MWQGFQAYAPVVFNPHEIPLVLISVTGWVEPRDNEQIGNGTPDIPQCLSQLRHRLIHSFYITSLILRHLSFCHQGQIKNFHILEVTGDLYNAMSNRQMGECSTHLGLDTRCIRVISFTTQLIYPITILPHRARQNAVLKTAFSSCQEYRQDSSRLNSVEKSEQRISCLVSFVNVRAGGRV